MNDTPREAPTIDLQGARLRPLRATDADALYAYLRDPAVTELTSYPVVSMPMVEAMIARSTGRWAAGELSRWGVAEASPHFFARFQRVRSPGAWKGAGNPREALPSQGCRKVTPTTGSGALRRQGFARVARAFPGAGRMKVLKSRKK